tara:strand:- start:1944 stop:2510 length:567 start_codon:yes stop_codon:yes gene_type:complete
MRIISGLFKGKKILEPKDLNTRPLKDMTKESIFNIINHSNKFSINLKKSKVLDLFAGTGSFGLECLSRNVKFVTFVENYIGILPILKKNLNNLRQIKNFEVIEKNILNNFDFENFQTKFDIIFLDPPYKEKDLKNLLDSLLNYNILNTNGIIIIHRHVNQIDNFPKSFQIIEEKKYGISKIIFGSYFN